MKKVMVAVLGSMLLFLSTPIFAVKMSSLYSAELAVPAQADEFKEQAIKEGFFRILVKLTGDLNIAKNPEIKANLLRADYYVQDFNYSMPSPSASEYILKIRYNERDVDRLLTRAGMTTWGENRPLILVWLAVIDKKNSTDIIGNEMPGDMLTTVEQAGKKFGLPLIFPMMDVADISQISPQDVVHMALPVLQAAAKRYAPEALLLGKLTEKAGGYQSEWQLLLNNKQWRFTVTEKTPDNLMLTVMNQVSQTLAKEYGRKTTTMQPADFWLKLEIMNITEHNDLTQIMAYFKKITVVQKVQLVKVSGDVAELSILVRGTLPVFLQKMASTGSHLALKYHDTADNRLGYVWIH